jgi:hypothetical protein
MTPLLNGWIAIPRSVLAADWYTEADTFTRALWLHLMLSANFTSATTRTGLVLQPGQLVTSWAKLAAELPSREGGHSGKATRSKVRRAAALLRKWGEATYHPTGGATHTGTVVTLERWALYAGELAQPTQEPAQEPTGGVPTTRPHRNNNTGSADPNSERRPTTREQVRREVDAFAERCRRGAQEVAETRARERGEEVH